MGIQSSKPNHLPWKPFSKMFILSAVAVLLTKSVCFVIYIVYIVLPGYDPTFFYTKVQIVCVGLKIYKTNLNF